VEKGRGEGGRRRYAEKVRRRYAEKGEAEEQRSRWCSQDIADTWDKGQALTDIGFEVLTLRARLLYSSLK